MELIERINSIDKEVKVLKGEIKSVLIDLRESMNTNENPFFHLKDIQKGSKPIDESRLTDLEKAIDELKGKVYGPVSIEEGNEYESDNERIQNLENALEALLNEGIENKNLINNLSESIETFEKKSEIDAKEIEKEIESLKESIEILENSINKDLIETEEYTIEAEQDMPIVCEMDSIKKAERDMPIMCEMDSIKNEDNITTNNNKTECDLEESDMDEERIKEIEKSLEQLKELNIIVAQELKSLKESFKNNTELNQKSEQLKSKSVENRINDMITLTRITQWASRTINLIGIEKLTHIVNVHKLMGSLSENEHAIILKIAEIPDISLNPIRTHIETRHSIMVLYELDCILNKTQTEAFTVLNEIIGYEQEMTMEDKNAMLTAKSVLMNFNK